MFRRVLLVFFLAVTISAGDPLYMTFASAPAGARDLGTRWIDQAGRVTHRVFGTQGAARHSPAAPDPDLEPGFPVQTYHGPGSYTGGQGIHTLVGDISGDGKLEILATGLATGPLYAWNHDGTPLTGWPVGEGGAAYPAIGKLQKNARNVFAAFGSGWLSGYAADGAYVPGWPRRVANYVGTPATLANIDAGRWEIFVEEEDWQLHAYRSNGEILPGWPVWDWGGQERHTPAVADLDGDGDREIVTASGADTGGARLFAYHHDGSLVAGFPVIFNALAHTFPAIGNVVGSRKPEIVFVAMGPSVRIYSATGVPIRSIGIAGSIFYSSAPALADLDGDGRAEIIVQSNGQLDVWYGDGRPFPGWPVRWSADEWLGNSSPVVGDVDGDGQPEIVVTSQVAGQGEDGDVRVYNADGSLHPRFPKRLKIGDGAVPAIADIDLDGRNEIVVCGDFWNGIIGVYDKCWAYDLGGGPHGPILWGQFGGNAAHQGRYPVP